MRPHATGTPPSPSPSPCNGWACTNAAAVHTPCVRRCTLQPIHPLAPAHVHVHAHVCFLYVLRNAHQCQRELGSSTIVSRAIVSLAIVGIPAPARAREVDRRRRRRRARRLAWTGKRRHHPFARGRRVWIAARARGAPTPVGCCRPMGRGREMLAAGAGHQLWAVATLPAQSAASPAA